jgi:hypothetical protein
MFTRFLLEKGEYLAVKRYWLRLFKDALPSIERRRWVKWLADEEFEFQDGESARVLSLQHKRDHKGICVQQIVPSPETVKFGARVDVFGKRDLKHPIEFLYIACELSNETAIISKILIAKWAEPNVTKWQMNRYIRFLTS